MKCPREHAAAIRSPSPRSASTSPSSKARSLCVVFSQRRCGGQAAKTIFKSKSLLQLPLAASATAFLMAFAMGAGLSKIEAVANGRARSLSNSSSERSRFSDSRELMCSEGAAHADGMCKASGFMHARVWAASPAALLQTRPQWRQQWELSIGSVDGLEVVGGGDCISCKGEGAVSRIDFLRRECLESVVLVVEGVVE